MSRDDSTPASFVPFEGSIRRSTAKEFPRSSLVRIERVGVDPNNQTVRFRHGRGEPSDRVLEPVSERKIEALVVEPAQGRSGALVTFINPINPDEMIGVVIGDDPRGEVDGVWVAEEDGDDGGGEDSGGQGASGDY